MQRYRANVELSKSLRPVGAPYAPIVPGPLQNTE